MAFLKRRLVLYAGVIGVLSSCNGAANTPTPTPLETIVATANVAEPITVS
jgi:hypothetical protein